MATLERVAMDRHREALPDVDVIFRRGNVSPAAFAAAASLAHGVRVPLESVRSGYVRRLPDGRVRAAKVPGPGAFPATWAAIGAGAVVQLSMIR